MAVDYPKELKTETQQILVQGCPREHYSQWSKGGNSPCPTTDELISKMWYMHTVEYYSALKMDGVLVHATMWMNPENM